jgi:pimeloyl-ACP methyl ester carboxylesterase
MPYANNNGVKIYYEVEGQGPPLVLAHGLGGDLNAWRRFGNYSYSDALRNDFQLIMFDFMGHGRSDKPHDPAIYRNTMHCDAIAVMDDLGISGAHYLGYSMGAALGFLTAINYPKRFVSFILGGMGPYPSKSRFEWSSRVLDEYKLDLSDPEGAVGRKEKTYGRPLTVEEKAATLATDVEARIAILTAGIPYLRFLDDNELSRIKAPCFVFCGELDPDYEGAKECVNHMPKARFISLPGLGHVQGIMRGDLVVPHIKEFLAQVSKT